MDLVNLFCLYDGEMYIVGQVGSYNNMDVCVFE